MDWEAQIPSPPSRGVASHRIGVVSSFFVGPLVRGLDALPGVLAAVEHEAAAAYVRNTLRYTLGLDEVEGMREFLRLAANLDLCDKDTRVVFCYPCFFRQPAPRTGFL